MVPSGLAMREEGRRVSCDFLVLSKLSDASYLPLLRSIACLRIPRPPPDFMESVATRDFTAISQDRSHALLLQKRRPVPGVKEESSFTVSSTGAMTHS